MQKLLPCEERSIEHWRVALAFAYVLHWPPFFVQYAPTFFAFPANVGGGLHVPIMPAGGEVASLAFDAGSPIGLDPELHADKRAAQKRSADEPGMLAIVGTSGLLDRALRPGKR
jgi:hypothetical protein